MEPKLPRSLHVKRVQVRRTLRCVLGVLLAAFTLEFCARLDDYVSYGAPMWGPYDTEIMYVQDNIGTKGKPFARYKKWQLNSLGFRGPELQPGRVRIICFGSSETFGLYEAPGEEYPRQLERELNSWAGRNLFQVVNVALPGETIQTQILRVPDIVREIRPQVALIYPSLAQYIWLPQLKPNPGAPTQAVSRPQFEWRIATNVRELTKQSLPSSVQNYLREREIQSEAATYGTVMDRVPEENIIRFQNDLRDLVKSLRDDGVQPVLVTHATRFGPVLSVSSASERYILVSWRKFFPMLKEDGFLDMEWRMNEAIRQVAAEQHLVLIDAAMQVPPGKQNFADFSHFTSSGARVMAVDLAAQLEPLLHRYATGDAPSNSR